MRVIMDNKTNEVIYDLQRLEDIRAFIDRLKILKRFK